MNKPTMLDAILDYERRQREHEEKIKQEVKAGLRILVEINGRRVYATKAEVIEAVKNFKTVRRIK